MADYTALVEAGNALVELLRDNLTPEPLGNRELIALCSPHESENNQLTLYLYHIEEESQNQTSGYYAVSRDVERRRPAQFTLRYLVTAQLHVSVEKTPLEQMLKIWNNTSKEYKLSFVVMITGVTIDSRTERPIARVTDVAIHTRQKEEGGAR